MHVDDEPNALHGGCIPPHTVTVVHPCSSHDARTAPQLFAVPEHCPWSDGVMQPPNSHSWSERREQPSTSGTQVHPPGPLELAVTIDEDAGAADDDVMPLSDDAVLDGRDVLEPGFDDGDMLDEEPSDDGPSDDGPREDELAEDELADDELADDELTGRPLLDTRSPEESVLCAIEDADDGDSPDETAGCTGSSRHTPSKQPSPPAHSPSSPQVNCASGDGGTGQAESNRTLITTQRGILIMGAHIVETAPVDVGAALRWRQHPSRPGASGERSPVSRAMSRRPDHPVIPHGCKDSSRPCPHARRGFVIPGWTRMNRSTHRRTDMEKIIATTEINADARRIYEALTTAAGVRGWWTVDAELDARVGCAAAFRFQEERGTMEVRFRVDVMEPNREVAWTCTGEHNNPDWKDTRIAFRLSPSGKSTSVELAHTGWRAKTPVYEMCVGGWTHFLASLKSLVETGKGTPHHG